MADKMNDTISPGPAVNAPVPVKTKIPVPMMAPIPKNVKSIAPRFRASPLFRLLAAIIAETSFFRVKLMMYFPLYLL